MVAGIVAGPNRIENMVRCARPSRPPEHRWIRHGRPTLVDLDDTIIAVHGCATQGTAVRLREARGLKLLIATPTSVQTAPAIEALWLRQGLYESARMAARSSPNVLSTPS